MRLTPVLAASKLRRQKLLLGVCSFATKSRHSFKPGNTKMTFLLPMMGPTLGLI